MPILCLCILMYYLSIMHQLFHIWLYYIKYIIFVYDMNWMTLVAAAICFHVSAQDADTLATSSPKGWGLDALHRSVAKRLTLGSLRWPCRAGFQIGSGPNRLHIG